MTTEGFSFPEVSTNGFDAASLRRLEDHRFITGAGRYIADLPVDDVAWASFVRSHEAHGTIRQIDMGDVPGRRGVLAVLTAAETGAFSWPTDASLPDVGRPLLASEVVRFVGEAVAVVIAESREIAEDAASDVWLDVEPLAPVVSLEDALADSILVHPHLGSNLVEVSVTGNVEEPSGAALVTTTTVRSQRLSAVPLEPFSAIAEPIGTRVRLWAGTQAPHTLASALRAMFGIEVDVVVPDVGGGFGQKIHFTPEYGVLVHAALLLGRPVGWLQTRRESLSSSPHGRDMRHTVTLHGDMSGRISRADIRIEAAVGSYPHTGVRVSRFAERVALGLYDIRDLRIERKALLSNTAPTAPYRGAGRPEAAYAIERAIDAFARAGDLDPVDVRRLNLIPQSAMPYRSPTGATYDSGDYLRALDLALELGEVNKWREEQARRRAEGGDPIGIGVGAFIESAGGPADSGEYGRVALAVVDGDVSIEVHTGSVSHGQGHETVWAQLAASVFGLTPQQVLVVAGNTERVAEGWGTMGSRSAQTGASAVWRTAHTVRDTLRNLVSGQLEASPEDVIFKDGMVGIRGVPASNLPLVEFVAGATENGVDLSAEEFFTPGVQTFPYGVHCAVVEVCVETGEMRILGLTLVDDCGNVLNPMLVRGQIDGSVAQGFGQAVLERIIYNEDGQLLSASLMDYGVPRATDMFPVTHGRLYSAAMSNPLGVKGTGEAGCIGVPAAIVNAAIDALTPYGVRALDTPLTPATIWAALREAAYDNGPSCGPHTP